MPDETQALGWVLPVAVQIVIPIVLAILGIVGGAMAAKIKAKNERIKQEQDHALALTAQQADFDGKKRAMALARDQQLYDTQQAIIDQLQETNRDNAHREARMDEKFNELYDNLGYERAHSMAWENWHRDGSPNPPGPPQRRPRTPPPATPPGGWLGD